jgi:thioesterase domain-containing protein
MADVLSPGEIEAYLHRHIPISAAMGVRVRACGAAGSILAAPLVPNLIHRATVFGGSASAVAILAAWTWLHFTLRTAGRPSRLVIQKNAMEYLAPIAGDFEAQCTAPSSRVLEKFLGTLNRHGKARITLGAVLTCDGAEVAKFSGDYVAVKLG